MASDEEVLEGMKAKAGEYMAKVAKAQRRANEWAVECGLTIPFPEVQDVEVAGGRMTVRPDQFGNHTTPSGAARAYLEMRGVKGGSTAIEDIFETLKRGGFAFNSTTDEAALGGLKTALGKDKAFRKLPNGSWGLWLWYPDAKHDKEDDTDQKPKSGKQANVTPVPPVRAPEVEGAAK